MSSRSAEGPRTGATNGQRIILLSGRSRRRDRATRLPVRANRPAVRPSPFRRPLLRSRRRGPRRIRSPPIVEAKIEEPSAPHGLIPEWAYDRLHAERGLRERDVGRERGVLLARQLLRREVAERPRASPGSAQRTKMRGMTAGR